MERYKNLISNIGNILQKEGFLKKGNTFYIRENDNWGILDFQKSRNSTLNEVLFTINIGVSLTILRKFNNEDLKQKPELEKSHWNKRVGFLLPEKKDYWWKINNDTDLEQLTDEISKILINVCIPEILKHISDESLEIEWLNGVSSGPTELQRYIFLTTLLKLSNSDKLPLYIEKLKLFSRGKAFEEIAKEHTKSIGF
jgi:hypothetical protein